MKKSRMAGRLVISGLLGGLVSLSSAMGVFAEDSTGIAISGDGDNNVNVVIDPTLIPDVQIKRSNGKMTIQIPDGLSAAKTGLDLDGGLKKSNTVQVAPTEQGRVITVNSDRVYLSIKDLSGQAVRPKESAPKPPVTPAKPAVSIVAKSVAPVPATPVVEKASGKAKSVGDASPKSSASQPEVTQGATAKSEKPVVSGQLLSIPGDSKSLNAGSAETVAQNAAPAQGIEQPEAEKPLSESVELVSPPVPMSEGKDGIPLEVLHQHREANAAISTGAMTRLILGLLLVLGMVVGFIRLVLPRLMTRYPQFVDALRKKQGLSGDALDFAGSDAAPQASRRPQAVPSVNQPASQESQSMNMSWQALLKKMFAPKNPQRALKSEPSKKNYLAQLGLPGELTDKFQVITSTRLGKGKELHLVAIKGRQLVIATTPYSVSLVADVTDSPASESFPPELQAPEADYAALPEEIDEPAPQGMLESATHAYVMDQAPVAGVAQYPERDVEPLAQAVNDTPKASPYMSRPHLLKHSQQGLYKKYLPPEESPDTVGGHETRRAAERHAQIVRELFNRKASGTLQEQEPPHYVDAEEVVVLEDYDDTYRN